MIITPTAEYVLQNETRNGDDIAVTTIIPYKITSSGELMNSFEYAATVVKTKASQEIPVTFVDVTVTSIASFAQMYNTKGTFYRHAGLQAYWNSNNSTISVYNMELRYESAGELYSYPDYNFIQSYFWIQSKIDKSYPTKNYGYIDGNNAMEMNNVLTCTDPFSHGGMVHVALDYKVNGKTYSHNASRAIYGK